MPLLRTVPWWKLDEFQNGLNTDLEHELQVQREAIPLIFVPGIMGTRLRLAGTRDREDNNTGGLPNMRWDPDSFRWMMAHMVGKDGAYRKSLLVGGAFNASRLEPADHVPPGNGFRSLMHDYLPFLEKLAAGAWAKPLDRVFEFPVYGFGYNWTGDIRNSGASLAKRIDEIRQEAKGITGLCEKVILITHSMGGLVARWASERAGAKGSILGIVHTVQPVNGAASAYWRMKCGFEDKGFLNVEARVLGLSAREVTPVLGNIPGGLELLPNKNYITNGHRKEWLTVVENGNAAVSVPTSNPYQEIYAKPAVTKPVVANHNPSGNRFWGLVDPDLLDPAGNSGRASTPSANQPNSILDAAAPPSGGTPFDAFLKELKKAESFHDDLHLSRHARTFVVRATGEKTVDAVQFKVRKGSASEAVYQSHGFRGHFTNGAGEYKVAEIQEASGRGDGTVSAESAKVFHSPTWDYEAKHQDVFKSSKIQEWAFESIVSLCKVQYEERRGSSAAQQQVRP